MADYCEIATRFVAPVRLTGAEVVQHSVAMDHTIKRRVLVLLADGTVTFDEAVKLSGASRSTVFRWCKDAGIDWRLARAQRVLRLWQQSERDRRRKPKPTKAQQHREADAAKVAWDQLNEDPERLAP